MGGSRRYHAMRWNVGCVQRRFYHPVGASPTEAKRREPRSLRGIGARKQADEALRQHAVQGACATYQVVTCSERRCSLVTRNSGGRAGLQHAKATRTMRKGV